MVFRKGVQRLLQPLTEAKALKSKGESAEAKMLKPNTIGIEVKYFKMPLAMPCIEATHENVLLQIKKLNDFVFLFEL